MATSTPENETAEAEAPALEIEVIGAGTTTPETEAIEAATLTPQTEATEAATLTPEIEATEAASPALETKAVEAPPPETGATEAATPTPDTEAIEVAFNPEIEDIRAPTPSPETQALEAAFEAARSDPSAILLDLNGRRVFQADGRVFKFGPVIRLDEAKTLSFIANSSLSVPVPKVFRAETFKDGTTVIEMEHIAGQTLEEVWPTLCEEEKNSYAKQMNAILEQLRSLSGQYIGGVEEGPAVDMRMCTERGGPFSNEADFNRFLRSNVIRRTPKIYHRMLASLMSETHRIVFSHGDIAPRNIMVRDGQIVALLDWECAGWYPENWEYVRFFRNVNTQIDWHEYSDVIFSQWYPSDVMTDHFLGRLTRH